MAAKPAMRLRGSCGRRNAALPSAAEPLHHLAVQCSEAAIESGQSPLMMACEGREVRVSDLAVTEQAVPGHRRIIEVVGPEAVPGMLHETSEHAVRLRRCGDCAVAQQQAQQGALGDRTGGERLRRAENQRTASSWWTCT